MLTELIFSAGDEKIPYYIADDFNSAKKMFVNASYDSYYIVCDKNADFGALIDTIFADINHHVVPIHISESDKTFYGLNRMIELLIDMGATRNSCLIAVGGGVMGNMVGLAASLLYRGISLIHVPTTIVAASDSVLSLKQAVNSNYAKNIIGSYYAPKFVCAIYPLLGTLSRRDYYSGLVEFAKNVLICNYNHEDFLSAYDYENYNQYNQFKRLIALSVEMKNGLISGDKFEKGNAIILEYGHTFGHAIEMISKGLVSHGEGVAFGMLAAAMVSKNMNLLNERDVLKHVVLLRFIFPQIKEIVKMNPAHIINAMEKDNKRGYIDYENGALPLVLLMNKANQNQGNICAVVNSEKYIIKESILEAFELINDYFHPVETEIS